MTPQVSHELNIDLLTKRYGEFVALNRVSLSVKRGEFLTLLGPSGSGKTTLLMSIAGFVQPDYGDIRLDQRSIVQLPPEQRNFGMVFQGYALFPHMTVFDNVAFPLRVRRCAEAAIREQVQASLDLVQLSSRADRYPRQLSGGQQQRVALARAMVFSPHLLLLDEPLSALDRNLRGAMQDELKRLHRKAGISFIYVTHDQDEALSMSDRIAVMREGHIVQHGTPDDLYERPATTFVADFLGRSNLIHGRIESRVPGGLACISRQGARFTQAVEDNDGPATDTEVIVALRPERIVIVDRDPQPDNVFTGEIVERNYFGAQLRLLVQTRGVGTIAVTVATSGHSASLSIGEPIAIGWDATAGTLTADH